MIRILLAAGLLLLVVSGCGSDESEGLPGNPDTAAPIKDATANFDENSPSSQTGANQPEPSAGWSESAGRYWGIEEGEALPILWEDLMPEGSPEALEAEYEAFYRALEKQYAEDGAFDMIEEGSELDYMPQFGSFDTVPELEGVLVRIPGYVVPFDFDPQNRQTEFLFAPYMGACIHTPPPPPNQLIYVEATPAVKVDDIYTAYWLEGTLASVRQDSDLASTAYTLQLTKIEPYGAP